MGITGSAPTLLNALLPRVRARVLGIFFGHPDQQFQLIEVISKAASGRGAVQREVKNLTDAGIVRIASSGNRKLYSANRESPIFAELRQLILKTAGLAEPLREALSQFRQRITSAFVYGSIAKGSDTPSSDIDLMVIGEELNYGEIYSALQKAETVLSRPINPNLMAPSDWARKLHEKNAFVVNVMNQPKLFVLGSQDDLGAIGQSRHDPPAES